MKQASRCEGYRSTRTGKEASSWASIEAGPLPPWFLQRYDSLGLRRWGSANDVIPLELGREEARKWEGKTGAGHEKDRLDGREWVDDHPYEINTK